MARLTIDGKQLDTNVPFGRGIEGAYLPDGKIVLVLDPAGTTPWKSNGPKGSMMAGSTAGFVTTPTGHKVNCMVLCPKDAAPSK